MKDHRIAIIGSSGYIGRNLLSKLRLHRNEVVEIADPSESMIDNKYSLESLVNKLNGISVVIHLASTTNPLISYNDPHLEFDNIQFTLLLIDACSVLGIKDLIFASSGGTVYKNSNSSHTEDGFIDPISPYGIGKIISENCLKLFAKKTGANVSVLRISNLFGPNQSSKKGQGVIPYIINCIRSDETVILYGNTVRDYIYIDDLVCAFEHALKQNIGFNIYNIGSGVGTSLSKLSELISKTLSTKVKLTINPIRDFDIEHNVLDCRKADKNLGWRTRYTLESALSHYLLSNNEET